MDEASGNVEVAVEPVAPKRLRLPEVLAGIDEAAVREAYELSAEPVLSIRKRFGLTTYALRKMREAGKWNARPPAVLAGPNQGRRPVGADALEGRLNMLLTLGVATLERRILAQGMDEAGARMLRELCRAQEAFMRATRTKKADKAQESKHDGAGGPSAASGAAGDDDLARLRAELKSRLDRLREDGGEGQT